jgi:type III pantothenate kinase
MIALIDAGNTTTEIKILNPKDNSYLNNYLLFTNEIVNNIKKIEITEQINSVIFTSVVPQMNQIIIDSFKNVKVLNVKESNKLIADDFSIDTKILGSDLITNFYALKNESDFILVTLGTATTLVVGKDKKFVTRIICPGIKSSIEGLKNNVKGFAIDSDMSYKKINSLDGLSTIDALTYGTFVGHKKMIEGLVDELKKTYNVKKVFITGGLSEKLKDLLNPEWTMSPNLIFEGLKFFI